MKIKSINHKYWALMDKDAVRYFSGNRKSILAIL